MLIPSQAAFQGFKAEAWSTYSDIGPWRFGILFAANMTHYDAVDLGPTSAGLLRDGVSLVTLTLDVYPQSLLSASYSQVFPKSIIYSWHLPRESFLFSDSHQIHLQGCSNEKFCLYLTSPVLTVQ